MQVQTISNNFNQQSFTGAIKISDNVAPKIRQQLDKILEDVDYLLTKSIQSRFFSGELFSGEV